ncbi:MAG: hypothetical protein ACE5HC_15605 [Candidatus Binatia bacterium]
MDHCTALNALITLPLVLALVIGCEVQGRGAHEEAAAEKEPAVFRFER